MTTLDRYIARQYLFNTVVLLVLLFAFVVTIDVALNVDRFVTTATRLTKEQDPSVIRKGLVTVMLIADLWWPRLLQLFNPMLGLVLAGAMGFTLTQLVRHRELVAVLASGVSLMRVGRPILVVAVAATLVQALNQELVIPRLAEQGLLTREYRNAGDRAAPPFEVRLLADSKGNRYYAKQFTKATGTLEGLHVWERDASGRGVNRISAESGVWREPTGGQPGYWELKGATVQPLGLTEAGSAAAVPLGGGGPVRLESDMDPTQLLLRRYASFSQSLSWGQISELLRSGKVDAGLHDQLERVRWGRVSLMIANLLALMITLPFFLTREPKNMVVQSLKCAPVGIITMMGAVLGTAASIPGLPPGFAVFLPVMVLTPIAIATLSAMKT